MRKLIYLFLLLLNLSFILAESNASVSEAEAVDCISSSIKLISEMNSSGFNTKRVEDLRKNAVSLYDAQVLIKSKNTLNYDFSVVLPYCEEISKMKLLAYSSTESLDVFKKFYNSTISPGMDTQEVDKSILGIEEEIKNERYENVDLMISKAYEQLSIAISSYSKLNVLYNSASNRLLRFIYLNRIVLIIFLVLLFLFLILYYKKIRVYFIKKKIKSLELRKETVKGLIQKYQREFFEKRSLSEGSYNIRVKKLGELILDVDRQIPLLKESLVSKGRERKENDKNKENLKKRK